MRKLFEYGLAATCFVAIVAVIITDPWFGEYMAVIIAVAALSTLCALISGYLCYGQGSRKGYSIGFKNGHDAGSGKWTS